MVRTLERTIVKPSHAFFGVECISMCGAVALAVFTLFQLFPIGLVVAVGIHVFGVGVRSKNPHANSLIMRKIMGRSKAHADSKGHRRIFCG